MDDAQLAGEKRAPDRAPARGTFAGETTMRLIESRGAREARRGQAILSVACHALLVAGAIGATRAAGESARASDAPQRLVYQEMVGPAHRRAGGAPSGAPRTAGPTTATAGGTPTGPVAPVPELTGIPDGIDMDPSAGAGSADDPFARRGGGGDSGVPESGAGAGGAWSAHRVEVPAIAAPSNPLPAYPEPLRTSGVTGRVVVDFVVDSTGRIRPGSVAIAESAHPLFTGAVRRVMPALRFLPARVGGRPVAQRVRMPFEFEVR